MKDLITAMAEFRANASIDKTGLNKFHNNSKYHTIDDLIKGLANTLDYGLGFTQTFEGNELVTTIMHLESGEKIEGRIYIGDYTDAQKWAGAVTYKRRIALVTMFGLSEPDADGNQTINTPARQANPPKIQTPAKSPAPEPPSKDEQGTPISFVNELKEAALAIDNVDELKALYKENEERINDMAVPDVNSVTAMFKQRKAELTRKDK